VRAADGARGRLTLMVAYRLTPTDWTVMADLFAKTPEVAALVAVPALWWVWPGVIPVTAYWPSPAKGWSIRRGEDGPEAVLDMETAEAADLAARSAAEEDEEPLPDGPVASFLRARGL
jgi:hypothetical protein